MGKLEIINYTENIFHNSNIGLNADKVIWLDLSTIDGKNDLPICSTFFNWNDGSFWVARSKKIERPNLTICPFKNAKSSKMRKENLLKYLKHTLILSKQAVKGRISLTLKKAKLPNHCILANCFKRAKWQPWLVKWSLVSVVAASITSRVNRKKSSFTWEPQSWRHRKLKGFSVGVVDVVAVVVVGRESSWFISVFRISNLFCISSKVICIYAQVQEMLILTKMQSKLS